MPLKGPNHVDKIKEALDLLDKVPKPSTLEDSYSRIASKPVVTHDNIVEEEPEYDGRWDSFQYAVEGYARIEDAVGNFPELTADPDICNAVSTIRNAKRAIEARAKEILGG